MDNGVELRIRREVTDIRCEDDGLELAVDYWGTFYESDMLSSSEDFKVKLMFSIIYRTKGVY